MEPLRYGGVSTCNFIDDNGDVVYGEPVFVVDEPDYESLAEEQAEYELQQVLAELPADGAEAVVHLRQKIAEATLRIKNCETHGMLQARRRTQERLGYSLAATAYRALLRGAFADEQFAVVQATFVRPYQSHTPTSVADEPYDDIKRRAANDTW